MLCCALGLATVATVPLWRKAVALIGGARTAALAASVAALIFNSLAVGSAFARSSSASQAELRSPPLCIARVIHL